MEGVLRQNPYPPSCCGNEGGNDVADTGDKRDQTEDEPATESTTKDTKDYVAKHRADRKKRLQGVRRSS